MTDDALAEQFPRRRTSEVRRLREVLHEYHSSGRSVVPDDAIAAHLARLGGEQICASCGERY